MSYILRREKNLRNCCKILSELLILMYCSSNSMPCAIKNYSTENNNKKENKRNKQKAKRKTKKKTNRTIEKLYTEIVEKIMIRFSHQFLVEEVEKNRQALREY